MAIADLPPGSGRSISTTVCGGRTTTGRLAPCTSMGARWPSCSACDLFAPALKLRPRVMPVRYPSSNAAQLRFYWQRKGSRGHDTTLCFRQRHGTTAASPTRHCRLKRTACTCLLYRGQGHCATIRTLFERNQTKAPLFTHLSRLDNGSAECGSGHAPRCGLGARPWTENSDGKKRQETPR